MAEVTKSAKTTQQCPSFDAAASRTVALGIDLLESTVGNSPQLLKSVVEDPKVKEAIAKALMQEGQKLMDEQRQGKSESVGSTMSRLGTAAITGGKAPAASKAANELKKTPEYRRLETGLKELKCSFDQTPVGVFVDENKTLLVVVAAVAAIGGGVAMYYTKAGDVPAKGYEAVFANLSPIKIGAVSLQAKKLEFKPSERKVDTALAMTGNWTNVKADLELRFGSKNDRIMKGGAVGSVVYTVDSATSLSSRIEGDWLRGSAGARDSIKGAVEVGAQRKLSERSSLSFHVYGTYEIGPKGETRTFGGRSGLSLQQPFGPDTSLSLRGSAESMRGRTAGQDEDRVMLHLVVDF
jgi:hypothetical protein